MASATGPAAGAPGRSWLEGVADAPDGLEVAGRDRVRLDLRPQAAHVDRHRAGVAGVAVLPDLIEELLAREDLAGPAGQAGQQVELRRREGDRPPAPLDAPPRRV